jgi:3-carboxy-cis,cis-muconate cycloisomerase
MFNDILSPLFVPDDLRRLLDGRAWMRALVRAEGALALAEADHGLVPHNLAIVIADAALTFDDDPDRIGRLGKRVGNPAAGAVLALTEYVAQVSPEAARYVHFGATSQDIVDTAAMLVAKDAIDLILHRLRTLLTEIAVLTRRHEATLMVGRTLLQHALPVTFGLKAANWLTAMLEATTELESIRASQLAAQLGGASGTLASLGENGLNVAASFAARLRLVEPNAPWHTDRTRIARIGNSLAIIAGTVGKICGDVILLTQTEVGELTVSSRDGAGGSSTMPHKNNPIDAVMARACAMAVPPLSMSLQLAMSQEHERAAAAWHTEWQTLGDALALTGGAVDGLLKTVEGLVVHPAVMRRNLDITRGQVMAESVTTRLTQRLGRLEAHHLMQRVSQSATSNDTNLADELRSDEAVGAVLDSAAVTELLDPAGYLGDTARIVQRALQRHETAREED